MSPARHANTRNTPNTPKPRTSRTPLDALPPCAALAVLALALLLLALAGCASPPPAPPMLYLPTTASAGLGATAPQPAAPGAAGGAQDWRLVTPIGLPAALDREAVMVATAPGQWQAWHGLRWAEPLRDALPRVLAADLSLLRQAPVWTGRLAPGQAAVPELRVDVDDWEAALASAQGPATVALRARWRLAWPDGRAPARTGTVSVRQPWPLATPAGLVQAQRAALQALAAGITAGITAGAAEVTAAGAASGIADGPAAQAGVPRASAP